MRSRHIIAAMLSAATLPCSWLLMMALHESGHVFHAWISGGHVTCIVLHPLSISRTDVVPNPHPAFERWGGPFWGCALPLLVWGLAAFLRARFTFLLRFLAGFCLIANGAYLGVGAWHAVGDAAQLRALGTPTWVLFAAGAPACALGLSLWNGLGPDFGIGPNARRVDPRLACGMITLTTAIVVLELTLSQ